MSAITSDPIIEKSRRFALRGERVRGFLAKGAEAVFGAGKVLIEQKADCEHGEWEAWLAKEFPLSERTAQRYMNAYRRFEAEVNRLAETPLTILEDETPAILIPKSAEDQKAFTNAALVVQELAPEPIRQRVQAGELGLMSVPRSITLAPENVRACATKWNVSDPSVMDTLTKCAAKLPDEFEAVFRSGVMQWPTPETGKPFSRKLAQVTGTEAREWYVALMRENGIIEHQGNSPQPTIDTTCTIGAVGVLSDDPARFVVTIEINEQTYRALKTLKEKQQLKQRLIIKGLTR